jgi:Cof subfamily protein (haloacid dehalogenase superfamily)
MEYKLLALDLDGTLLNDEENISENNLAFIERASQKGVKIIINTGRSHNSAKRYIKHINVHDPIITFNGAVIVNGDEILRKITISNEIVHNIIQLLKDMAYSPIVYLADGNKYYETFGSYTEEFLSFSKGFESELVKINSLSESIWNDVMRLSVVTGAHDVPLLHSELKNKFGSEIKTLDTFFSGWNFWIFEMLNKTCSKSTGLEFLCNLYGISKSEVIAVGDNNNDLDMISWAGLGVAMKNGLDAALREADYVTEKTNNEDGVAEVIEKFIL